MAGKSFLQRFHETGQFDGALFGSGAALELQPATAAAVEAFLAVARDFPAARIEAEGRVPGEALQRMAAAGLFGLTIPAQYGGAGLPFRQYLEVVRRIGPVDLSLALVSLAHLSIGVQGLVLYGSPEQKQRYLPRAAAGELVFAYALTEPKFGSDAQHIETRARISADGEHYLLDGQKTYITNANYAGAFTVFAQLDDGPAGHMGAFVVERDWEGVTVGPDMPKMGLKGSSTAFLRFAGVRVPAANRIAAPGEGFKVALGVLSYGRLAVCAAGVGLMEQSLADMTGRARGRVQFGQPIAAFELVQEKLAAAQVNAHVAADMVDFAARQLDADPLGNTAVETSHCKYFATTRAWQTLYDAQQVAGGSGYLASNPYEKRLRDYRVATIFEGTTEIHSMYPALLLARSVARALPRSRAGRLWALLRGAARRPQGPPSPDHPVLRRALRTARGCGRRFRVLLHLGLLLHGKRLPEREFLLRRITRLGVYQYGLLAAVAGFQARRRGGRDVAAELERIEYFTSEARAARSSGSRLFADRRERLAGRLAARGDERVAAG